VSPSDYPWYSFALSVAVGGTAVFLCVGSVVIARLCLFRSRSLKRESTNAAASAKKHHQHHPDDTSNSKPCSGGNLQPHEMQFELSKDGISSDDKDPDIIPSNIGSLFVFLLLYGHVAYMLCTILSYGHKCVCIVYCWSLSSCTSKVTEIHSKNTLQIHSITLPIIIPCTLFA